MKMKKEFIFAFVLFVGLACVMPNLSQPTSLPVDSLSIPTIVVLTADAAMTQTASAAPPLPLETPTPVPTETPTATAAPVFSSYGSALVPQADDTVLFIDQKSGFQMTFPANWVVLRPNHDEYYSLSVDEAITHPFLQFELDVIKDHNPDETRVHAFDVTSGHLQDEYTPHISVHWVEGIFPPQAGPVEWIELMKFQEEVFDVLVSPNQMQNPQNIIIGSAEITAPSNSLVTNLDIHVYERRIYMNTNKGSVFMIFSTLSEIKDQVTPDFEQTIDSITLIEP
jgi:hypothetical protein